MSKIKLTESKLKKIISESVKEALKESINDVMDQDRQYYEYIQEEKKKHQALADFLNRNGVKSAHLSQYQSGLPVVAISTDEYYETDVHSLADKFLRGKKAYISVSDYPATTYVRINEL